MYVVFAASELYIRADLPSFYRFGKTTTAGWLHGGYILDLASNKSPFHRTPLYGVRLLDIMILLHFNEQNTIHRIHRNPPLRRAASIRPPQLLAASEQRQKFRQVGHDPGRSCDRSLIGR